MRTGVPRRWVSPIVAAVAVIAARCGDTAPPPVPQPSTLVRFEVPSGLSAALTAMLERLPLQIIQMRQANEELLPRNPNSRVQIESKIALLLNPSLAGEMVNARRWAERDVRSIDGRGVTLVALFPVEEMRSDVDAALELLQRALPLLEAFFDVPYPAAVIRVWYGFTLGNSGGAGLINTEDRATYESRTPSSRLPLDAILGHELSHAYISNEALNQFLEVFLYSMIQTGSADLANVDRSVLRGWIPNQPGNQDLGAVLDVWQLVGLDVMQRAYRAIHPLRPLYGSPLPQATVDAFVGQVPAAHQATVAAKLAKVMF